MRFAIDFAWQVKVAFGYYAAVEERPFQGRVVDAKII